MILSVFVAIAARVVVVVAGEACPPFAVTLGRGWARPTSILLLLDPSIMYDYDRTAAISVPTDYDQAKRVRDQLEEEVKATGSALTALSGGGRMNMTPDHVRKTPEWQKAKREADAAFAALRAFNTVFVRRFESEIAARRRR